jgi:3-oxoacyl-[acyl-carrier-protein] synthase-1
MPASDCYVVALGASTPVGRDAWSSAAAVRAGITGFTEHPYMIDTAGEPMRVAFAPWLDPSVEGIERLQALLFPAIDDALLPIADAGPGGLKVALSLGLPASRPGLPVELDRQLRHAINNHYPGRFVGVAAFPNGHAAALLALDAAFKKLSQGAFDACVVAGVESYMSPETLEWLEANDQLHGAGPLNNAWGFIPGEGAGAILLATRSGAEALGIRPLAAVRSVGLGTERNRIKTETVCIGEGLTQAFRATLGSLPEGVQVTDVYCDMNGEPYRADEYGFACVRTKEWFVAASEFISPADCWGDVSAATGPLCVTLSVVASHKAYANGALAFVWTSSESGERAGALLETFVPGD